MEKKWPIISLGISFIFFSLTIPITQNKIDEKMEAGRAFIDNINQSQAKITLVQYNLDFANILEGLLDIYKPLKEKVYVDIKTEKLQKLVPFYTENGTKELRYAIICLYYVLNNKLPEENLIEKWKKMNFQDLNDKQVNMFKDSNLKSSERAEKIKKMINIKWLFYGFAAFFYIIGTILQIIVREPPVPK